MKSKASIMFSLIENLIIGLGILLLGFFIWYRIAGNPINEFRLIANGKIAKGYLTDAEEFSDIVEVYDRKSEVVYDFFYKYYFTLPNGKIINDSTISGGRFPEYLSDLENEPFPIEVEYLSVNPKINRVNNLHGQSKTIGEWLWRKVGFGGIFLIVCLSIGFIYLKNTLKDFNKDMKVYKGSY